jgi:hypothetical protein
MTSVGRKKSFLPQGHLLPHRGCARAWSVRCHQPRLCPAVVGSALAKSSAGRDRARHALEGTCARARRRNSRLRSLTSSRSQAPRYRCRTRRRSRCSLAHLARLYMGWGL